ncbi:putative protein serine/threonine kinase [Tieghemostelium lacteum]|uniref:non-specific serine/threonine protein kinase n=1 Tax=Tieghemostelium lacteum TaxID=361077 RepID=A0A152A4I7_TIELA|nr:putative protein serine/threonine kinase [Tieghemostelium lacteum]|eukprot:KYR01146.1 putative protein serine/threonine kinase [Tieghemostelium lacteum]
MKLVFEENENYTSLDIPSPFDSVQFDLFHEKLETILSDWDNEIGDVDALIFILGDYSECKTMSIQNWLFQTYLLNLVFVMTKSHIYVCTNEEFKVNFFELLNQHRLSKIKIKVIHNSTMEENQKEFTKHLKGTEEKPMNIKRVATCLNDEMVGDFANSWMKYFRDQSYQWCDLSLVVSKWLLYSIDMELVLLKIASIDAVSTLKETVTQLIEAVRAGLKPAFTQSPLQIHSAYDYHNVDQFKYANSDPDSIDKTSPILLTLTGTHKTFQTQISRTYFPVYPDGFDECYMTLCDVHQYIPKIIQERGKISSIYEKTCEYLIKCGKPFYVSYLPKYLGYIAGLDFDDEYSHLRQITPWNDTQIADGMCFYIHTSFIDVDLDPETFNLFSLILGDTYVLDSEITNLTEEIPIYFNSVILENKLPPCRFYEDSTYEFINLAIETCREIPSDLTEVSFETFKRITQGKFSQNYVEQCLRHDFLWCTQTFSKILNYQSEIKPIPYRTFTKIFVPLMKEQLLLDYIVFMLADLFGATSDNDDKMLSLLEQIFDLAPSYALSTMFEIKIVRSEDFKVTRDPDGSTILFWSNIYDNLDLFELIYQDFIRILDEYEVFQTILKFGEKSDEAFEFVERITPEFISNLTYSYDISLYEAMSNTRVFNEIIKHSEKLHYGDYVESYTVFTKHSFSDNYSMFKKFNDQSILIFNPEDIGDFEQFITEIITECIEIKCPSIMKEILLNLHEYLPSSYGTLCIQLKPELLLKYIFDNLEDTSILLLLKFCQIPSRVHNVPFAYFARLPQSLELFYMLESDKSSMESIQCMKVLDVIETFKMTFSGFLKKYYENYPEIYKLANRLQSIIREGGLSSTITMSEIQMLLMSQENIEWLDSKQLPLHYDFDVKDQKKVYEYMNEKYLKNPSNIILKSDMKQFQELLCDYRTAKEPDFETSRQQLIEVVKHYQGSLVTTTLPEMLQFNLTYNPDLFNSRGGLIAILRPYLHEDETTLFRLFAYHSQSMHKMLVGKFVSQFYKHIKELHLSEKYRVNFLANILKAVPQETREVLKSHPSIIINLNKNNFYPDISQLEPGDVLNNFDEIDRMFNCDNEQLLMYTLQHNQKMISEVTEYSSSYTYDQAFPMKIACILTRVWPEENKSKGFGEISPKLFLNTSAEDVNRFFGFLNKYDIPLVDITLNLNGSSYLETLIECLWRSNKKQLLYLLIHMESTMNNLHLSDSFRLYRTHVSEFLQQLIEPANKEEDLIITSCLKKLGKRMNLPKEHKSQINYAFFVKGPMLFEYYLTEGVLSTMVNMKMINDDLNESKYGANYDDRLDAFRTEEQFHQTKELNKTTILECHYKLQNTDIVKFIIGCYLPAQKKNTSNDIRTSIFNFKIHYFKEESDELKLKIEQSNKAAQDLLLSLEKSNKQKSKNTKKKPKEKSKPVVKSSPGKNSTTPTKTTTTTTTTTSPSTKSPQQPQQPKQKSQPKPQPTPQPSKVEVQPKLQIRQDDDKPPLSPKSNTTTNNNNNNNNNISKEEYNTQVGKFKFNKSDQYILGRGSNGTTVFKGIWSDRIPVAIKRMMKSFNPFIHKEIDVLMKLTDENCQNIVRYVDQEDDGDFVYLGLTLCERSLFDLVEKKELNQFLGLDNSKLKALVEDLLNGIKFLHDHDIVHNDLNPRNILIKDGKFLISDLGLSKMEVETSYSFTMHVPTGQDGYHPAEVITEQRKTKSVDIFAIGCIIYYLATNGDHPFGDKFERVYHITKGIHNLELIKSDLYLCDLVSNMIKKDSNERISIDMALKHPYFWGSDLKIKFLNDCNMAIKNPKFKNQLTDKFLDIDSGGKPYLPKAWNKIISSELIESSSATYNFDHVRDLIRAFRNITQHYQELKFKVPSTSALNQILTSEESIYNYFEQKFPNLLFYLYIKFKSIGINPSTSG